MQSLLKILELEQIGAELTKEEAEYLRKYRELRHVKHSASFVSHAKFVPEEPQPDGNPN